MFYGHTRAAPATIQLGWSEVKPGLLPSQFHIRNATDRFSQTGDLFAPVLTNRQRRELAIKEARVSYTE